MAEQDYRKPSGADRLDYRDGAADRVGVSGVQVFGGFIGGLIFTCIAVLAAILNHMAREILIGFCIIVVVINALAFLAYRRPHLRGLGIGLWIGFGVAVLIEGACFGLGR